MFKKLQLSLLLSFLIVPFAMAQTGTLSGTVTDAETGETIPGANILITQLDRGVASDMDGDYEIPNVPVGTYTLNVSFVGYQTYSQSFEIQANQTTELDVALQTGAIGLDEVVVSGYASTPKRELTGSISSVRSQDIQDVPLQSTEALLQGRAAGVQVTTTSGNPGGGFSVNIRGNGSINAASRPLYIVDGVQISFDALSTQSSTTPLNAINPSDIESIEVLKDASSAAIYGAEAANGVVIITTKQGQAGRTQVTARAETGVRNLARNVDYINEEQYLDYLGEAFALNSGVPLSEDITPFRDSYRNFLLGFFGADPNSPEGDPQLANTDWQDFIFQEGVTQNYNISVSGGDDVTTFFISGNWEDTEGTAFNTDFSRLALRTNVDHQINDKWDTSVKVNLSRSQQFGVCQDGNFINCPPSQAMFEPIFSFPFNADGSYNALTRFGLGNNPAVTKNEVDRLVDVVQIISSARLQYNATDWLSFTGQAAVDYRNTEDEQFRSAIASAATGGFIFFANRNVRNINTNVVANLRQSFGGVHNVSGLIGAEYRRNFWETQFTRGDGLPGPFFKVLNATATPTTAGGVNSEWRRGSYFANAKYNYDEKYFLNVVARYDGHSRFGSETRWGLFPSVSGAWRISEEDFFNVSFINELKLRAGYGTTGNSNIGNFAARGLYSAVGSYQGSTGLRPVQLANVNLGWEEAVEVNVGLDYEVLDGRISGAIDVYQKDNNELLFGRPLPISSGYGSITENIGSVRNSGLEFEINTVNVNTGDFTWSSRFNVAFTDQEILELPDGEDIRPNSVFTSLQEGEPIGLIQVPRWAGVNPADGRPMWYDADGNITFNPVQADDAIKYEDGIANTIGGFGNTFNYKGLSLDAFFQFSFGQWAFPQSDFYFTRTPDFLMNLTEEVLDRWKQPGDITYYPRAIEAGGDFPETVNYRTTLSTQAISNASYIRLKNISLSYTLPNRLTDRVGLSNVRVFATGVNLLTWTAWPYYDPEVAFDETDIYQNVTAASYPTERQVNAGIEIRF